MALLCKLFIINFARSYHRLSGSLIQAKSSSDFYFHLRFTYKFQGLDAKLSGVEKAQLVQGILS